MGCGPTRTSALVCLNQHLEPIATTAGHQSRGNIFAYAPRTAEPVSAPTGACASSDELELSDITSAADLDDAAVLLFGRGTCAASSAELEIATLVDLDDVAAALGAEALVLPRGIG